VTEAPTFAPGLFVCGRLCPLVSPRVLLYPYWIHMCVLALIRTEGFADWLDALQDRRAKARILARLTSAEQGNFGDCNPIGSVVADVMTKMG
jgi:hypothetical protein